MNFLYFLLHRSYLVFFLWYKHFLRIAASSIAFWITLSIVVLFLGVMRPLKNFFTNKLESSLPGEFLQLRPRDMAQHANPLSLFQENPDIRFGISRKELERIKKWKGIQDIHYTQMFQRPVLATLRHPILANLGGGLRFDVLFQGVTKKLVKPYLFCMKNFQPVVKKNKITDQAGITRIEKEIILPIVIPELYINIAQVWMSVNRLPIVELASLKGFDLELKIGTGLLTRKTADTVVTGRICGYVPEGIVTTIGAPLSWVRSQHLSYGMRIASESFDQIFVRVKNPKDVAKMKKRFAKMGIRSSTPAKKYKNFTKWLNNIDYIFWSVAVILFVLSAISLINSFTLLASEKKYEFGLYLLFGSSPIFLAVMMFLQGAFWGVIHSLLGFYLADNIFIYLKNNLEIMKLYPDLAAIEFKLLFKEKAFIFLGAVFFTGLSSMLPTIFLMYNKTVELVKKD